MAYKEKPISSSLPGRVGLVTFLLFLWLTHGRLEPSYVKASYLTVCMFITMGATEAWLNYPTKQGLLWHRWDQPWDGLRLWDRLTGWLLVVCPLMLPFWVFPEYQAIGFFNPFYKAMLLFWPYVLGFLLLCLFWEDRTSASDTYCKIGRAFYLMQRPKLGPGELKQLFLGWTVKLYYLPIMFVSLADVVNWKIQYDTLVNWTASLSQAFNCLDTAVGVVGYLFASRLLASHIRSAEPTILGWVATLMCYTPFWSLFSSHYLAYGGGQWHVWLQQSPTWLIVAWSSSILVCEACFVWCTLSFGTRFSNLTHRGIVICGPYAYCQHPAYISKLVAYLLLYIPFAGQDLTTVTKHMLLWLLLAGIYYVRAKTEEAHLRTVSSDYEKYATEVKEKRKNLWRTFWS